MVSGIAMAFISFLLTTEIGAGALTYIGEAFSTSLILFGLGYYVVSKVGEMRREIRSEFDEMRLKEERREE